MLVAVVLLSSVQQGTAFLLYAYFNEMFSDSKNSRTH
jgi:hypothetical protein